MRSFPRQDVQASVRYSNMDATSLASPPSNRPSRTFQNSPGPEDDSYFARSFNSNVVLVMIVSLLAVVVAGFINTVARCVLRRRRLQLPEEQNGGTDHKGLNASVIEALPVVAYGAVFDPAGENECVVCLSELVHGERLRLLPECQHGFHVGCIDAWLVTHKTCPVCRRNVVSGESEADARRRVAVGGSARFGSARIASVDIEIEASGQSASESAAAADPAASSSTSRPNRSIRSMWPTEAMAILIHGELGSRRFGLQSHGRV